MGLFSSPTKSTENNHYRVAIAGAGIVGVGCSFALSLCKIPHVVIDANFDVGEETSKGNSAIIHSGFDIDKIKNTMEFNLVRRGSLLWRLVAPKLKIPFSETGALMLAQNENEAKEIKTKWLNRSIENIGVENVDYIDNPKDGRISPLNLSSFFGGLFVKSESIIDPFCAVYRLAEASRRFGGDKTKFLLGHVVEDVQIIQNKVELLLKDKYAQNQVINGDRSVDIYRKISADFLINSAGLTGSDLIGKKVKNPSIQNINIYPRRGEFIVYDNQFKHHYKNTSKLSTILLPVPSKISKGMLIAPTVFGNVIAGPTAENLQNEKFVFNEYLSPIGESIFTNNLKREYAPLTTVNGISSIRQYIHNHPYNITQQEIATYAGLRCASDDSSDYIIETPSVGGIPIIHLTNIRSTGLSSSLAIGEIVVNEIIKYFNHKDSIDLLHKIENEDCLDKVEFEYPDWFKAKLELLGDDYSELFEQNTHFDPKELINQSIFKPQTDSSESLCFCENIPRSAVKRAISDYKEIINDDVNIDKISIDSIKRRTRIGMGCCQGFHCGTLLAAEIGLCLEPMEKGVEINSLSEEEAINSESHLNQYSQITREYEDFINSEERILKLSKSGPLSPIVFEYDLYEVIDRLGRRDLIDFDQSIFFREFVDKRDDQSSKNVVIIGGGPAGLSCFIQLKALLSIRNIKLNVLLLERTNHLGGIPYLYSSHGSVLSSFFDKHRLKRGRDFILPFRQKVANICHESLNGGDGNFMMLTNANVIDINRKDNDFQLNVISRDYGHLNIHTDVIVIATGAREASLSERNSNYGDRRAGVLYGKHFVESFGHFTNGIYQFPRVLLTCGDFVGLSIASKISRSSSQVLSICRSNRYIHFLPEHPIQYLLGSLYFNTNHRISTYCIPNTIYNNNHNNSISFNSLNYGEIKGDINNDEIRDDHQELFKSEMYITSDERQTIDIPNDILSPEFGKESNFTNRPIVSFSDSHYDDQYNQNSIGKNKDLDRILETRKTENHLNEESHAPSELNAENNQDNLLALSRVSDPMGDTQIFYKRGFLNVLQNHSFSRLIGIGGVICAGDLIGTAKDDFNLVSLTNEREIILCGNADDGSKNAYMCLKSGRLAASKVFGLFE